MEILLPDLRDSCLPVFWLLAIVAVVVGLSRRRPALLGLTAALCATVLCVGCGRAAERAKPAAERAEPAAGEERAERAPPPVDLAPVASVPQPTRAKLMNSDAILTRALADRALSNVTPLTARDGMMDVMRAGLAPPDQTDRYLRRRTPAAEEAPAA